MITSFNLFESVCWSKSSILYKKKDYVLIDVDEIKINNLKELVAGDPPDNMAQIIRINIRDNYPYHVEFINGQTLQLRPIEILRKLTPSEIVEFESKKSAVKYNL